MIILNKYDEFGKGMGFPSMKEFFMPNKYENQDEIVTYLRTAGKMTMISTAIARDVFTGKRIDVEKGFVNDGVYSWSTDLAHYVEIYNLRLQEDFEKHILQQQNK